MKPLPLGTGSSESESPNDELLSKLRQHWKLETCGTRHGEGDARLAWFAHVQLCKRSSGTFNRND